MSSPVLLVIAKEPRAGRSKTRLCPPCSPEEAAQLAEAALSDTLAAVAAAEAERRIIVLDGSPGVWLPEGFEVVPQREGGLDERLAGAFDAAEGPAFLVGMDTPQLRPEHVDQGVAALSRPGVDAVIGGADDGGYWSIGLRRPEPRVFRGVAMSVESTGALQRERLRGLGLRYEELPPLLDVDTIDDARIVALEAPDSHFARLLGALRGGALVDPAADHEAVPEPASGGGL